jgi:hypothetical protein
MTVKVWTPGSDPELDVLFDKLRIAQFENQEDRLWYNYSESAFLECDALCIAFDDQENPQFCSSILKRSCWPDNTYRVLNRLWKTIPKMRSLHKGPGLSFLNSIAAQIQWLKENRTADLIFVSRKNDNWQTILLDSLDRYGMPFKADKYKYLTCSDINDEDCWQYIAYCGDESRLLQWERR